MGKRFDSIMAGFSNGSQSPPAATGDPSGVAKRLHGDRVRNMTPEERRRTLDLAHSALKGGLTVFMAKDTVQGFNRLLKTTVTKKIMRRLLVEVAEGRLTLMRPPTGQVARPAQTTKLELPTVLSIDQLSAGIPFTLKQAARILNVDEGKLYYRCLTKKIHFERDRSRYYIPAIEVQRLQVVGL